MFILLFALSHDVLSHLGEVIYPVISSSQVGFFFGSFLGMCSGGGIADVVPKLGCHGSGHSKEVGERLGPSGLSFSCYQNIVAKIVDALQQHARTDLAG